MKSKSPINEEFEKLVRMLKRQTALDENIIGCCLCNFGDRYICCGMHNQSCKHYVACVTIQEILRGERMEKKQMSKEEARTTLLNYISAVGGIGVEQWSEKDADVMRECVETLSGTEDLSQAEKRDKGVEMVDKLYKKQCGNCGNDLIQPYSFCRFCGYRISNGD